MATTDVEPGDAGRRPRWPLVVGRVGCLSVGIGYFLEAIRQRGSCDLGDPSPDTLALEVVLILWVGGLLQVVVLATTLVAAIRRRWPVKAVVGMALPSLVSSAGALAIFAVAGDGPATWFQHCGT